jgi:hypothetical protein
MASVVHAVFAGVDKHRRSTAVCGTTNDWIVLPRPVTFARVLPVYRSAEQEMRMG